MEATIRNGIHFDATRMNIHDLVRELNGNVGASVVQTMAGVKDRTSPFKWAKPDGPEPRPEVEARLRLGYRVWRTLEMVEGKHVALAWLMGANPRLGEELPVLCIQQQRSRAVIGAAEAFVNDSYTA
ncbi:hypothetical protein CVV68_01635 [Arthrobacter livingstonensis]|uniref:Antitoxin Xre/MbcA/ParS-like toxin-binding domain-containing protein n=1 Tax=Arthrobacter livingstonensis TaxID=670078 RepID=A0A2V5LHW2_9MICC|nr:hypothetical protein [Arthrobacter livingstonensis]PYI69833.1 hypothetical protein CVV68_01635 [Arthrobacter livingstonensis]